MVGWFQPRKQRAPDPSAAPAPTGQPDLTQSGGSPIARGVQQTGGAPGASSAPHLGGGSFQAAPAPTAPASTSPPTRGPDTAAQPGDIDSMVQGYVQKMLGSGLDTSAQESFIKQMEQQAIGTGTVENRAAAGRSGQNGGVLQAAQGDMQRKAANDALQNIFGVRQQAIGNAEGAANLDINERNAANQKEELDARLAALQALTGPTPGAAPPSSGTTSSNGVDVPNGDKYNPATGKVEKDGFGGFLEGAGNFLTGKGWSQTDNDATQPTGSPPPAAAGSGPQNMTTDPDGTQHMTTADGAKWHKGPHDTGWKRG